MDDKIRNHLLRERDDAIARLRRLDPVAEDVPAPVRPDSVFDRADEILANEQRELGLLSRQRLAARINGLAAALRRLEQGTYGRCTECGNEIEPARLAAIPEAATCVRCQADLEARAARGAAA